MRRPSGPPACLLTPSSYIARGCEGLR
jgi:hypothetical protein